MKSRFKQTLLAFAVIVFGFAVIFVLSGFLEKKRPALPAGFEDEDLALQGAQLKGYALGFEGLIADWYWMKSLQYIGDKVLASDETFSLDNLNPLNPRLLYPYLDNATSLDPQFMSVYEYGAVILPAIDNEQAIKLTEKGIDNNPNQWRLYQYLGYIYWRMGNYQKASEVYEKGSQIAGAPDVMKFMAAKMKTEGGSRATARDIYREMSEKAEDAQTRNLAVLRLQQLDSMDEREIIQNTLSDFKGKNGRCANNWRELLPFLQNEKLPGDKDFRVDNAFNLVDPSGAAYVLDKESCVVKLDTGKTKILLN